jgi:hypothetical protein
MGCPLRREAEFLQMLDSPRIVACSDVIDDGRQLVRYDPPRLRPAAHLQQLLDEYTDAGLPTVAATGQLTHGES